MVLKLSRKEMSCVWPSTWFAISQSFLALRGYCDHLNLIGGSVGAGGWVNKITNTQRRTKLFPINT